MSFPLATVDLSTAAVGTKGSISLNNVGISAGGVTNNPAAISKPATLFLFNDSGCGLQISFSQSGGGFNLPAGAWVPVPLPPGENKVNYVVLYVLPSPPVSLLMLTYYEAGESIPQSMTLGNSPVGIGGSVTTSSVQTLSNETAALGTKIIDIGTLSINDLLDIFNDHFLWKVQQSGVAHQVLAGNTAGNPLQLGQAGDTSEVLGSLAVDQTLTVTGKSTLDNAKLTTDGVGNVIAQSLVIPALGTGIGVNAGGVGIAGGGLSVTGGNASFSNDVFLVNKKLSTAVSGDLANWSGAGLVLGGNPSNHGKFSYQGDGTNTDVQLSVIAPVFSGTGGGTFNHNTTQFGAAATPTDFLGNASTSGGSNSNGFGSITTTQVAVGSLNAVAWRYNAVIR